MDYPDVTTFGDSTRSRVGGIRSATFEITGICTSGEGHALLAAIQGGAIYAGGPVSGTPPPDYGYERKSITVAEMWAEAQGRLTNTKEQTPHMQIFEYAAVYLPEDDDGNLVKKDARILIQPTTRLAEDETQVRKQALREVTLNDGDDLDFVQVAVRPFAHSYS